MQILLTDFREPTRRVLILGALAMLLVPGLAFAQAPTQLAPPWMRADGAPKAEPQAVPQPNEATSQPPTPSPRETRGALRSATGPESIESHHLEAMDIDAFGLLDASHGGFGATMWQGTSREVVQRVLPRLPLNAPSHVLYDLTSRLLLSTAIKPVSTNKEDERPLLPLRAERLLALGNIRGLHDMVAIMPAGPARSPPDGVLRAMTESLFIDGNAEGACADGGIKARAPSDPFWQKYFVLCQAIAGARETAFLGMDLLREQGHDDSIFHDGIWAILGPQKITFKILPDPSPLHIAVLTAAKQPFPRDVLKSRTPGILRAVANSPSGAIETRIEAAERAEAIGAFDASALRLILSSIEFSDKEKAEGKTRKGLDKGPRGRALLYQAAFAETDPTAKAEAIARALDLAGSGGFMTAARLYQPLIETLKPIPDMIASAESLGRALFASDRAEQAAGWLTLARELSPRSDAAARAANALWPLARLAQPRSTTPLDPAVLAGWRAAQGKISPEKLRGRTYTLLNLLDSAGEPISPTDWGDLLEADSGRNDATHTDATHTDSTRTDSTRTDSTRTDSTRTDSTRMVKLPTNPAWNLLAQASGAGRVAETVMFSVAVMAGQDPGATDPITLYHVITALRRVGLEHEGRALALEAMIGSLP